MLKASAGGGGKGMRIAWNDALCCRLPSDVEGQCWEWREGDENSLKWCPLL